MAQDLAWAHLQEWQGRPGCVLLLYLLHLLLLHVLHVLLRVGAFTQKHVVSRKASVSASIACAKACRCICTRACTSMLYQAIPTHGHAISSQTITPGHVYIKA
jgi:hypothetical protein